MTIYTIGHISPDLDAVAAPYAYADFLNKYKRYKNTIVIPLASEKPNRETIYIFNKLGIDLPKTIDEVEIKPEDRFILVDHNEESQRSPKVSADKVIEIVDHHKINVNFTTPIRLDVKPLGSTCSQFFEQYEMHDIEPGRKIQRLMLAGILSDTQGLQSSTTTEHDGNFAKRIVQQTGDDIGEFTFEIFKAKSDITGLSIKDLCTRDYKIFDFNETKVLISQLETVEPKKLLNMKTEIIKEMTLLKKELEVSQAYMVLTDILKVSSLIIVTNEKEKKTAEKAFSTKITEGVGDIGKRMSRKKDIAPEIERVILKTS